MPRPRRVWGWLNAKGAIRASAPFSATVWAADLFQALGISFASQNAPIAHIKVHIITPASAVKARLTRAGAPVSWDLQGADAATHQAHFIVNARVNTV